MKKPLVLDRDTLTANQSGTPYGLLETARKNGDLVELEEVAPRLVLIEFPMGEAFRAQTGCPRFVRLRTKIEGCEYAVVRTGAPVFREAGATDAVSSSA